jgi:hypothetical protein
MGDVAGHEFHGNQYTDGGSSAQRASQATKHADSMSAKAKVSNRRTDHRTAADAAKLASSAHEQAYRSTTIKEVKAHHDSEASRTERMRHEHHTRSIKMEDTDELSKADTVLRKRVPVLRTTAAMQAEIATAAAQADSKDAGLRKTYHNAMAAVLGHDSAATAHEWAARAGGSDTKYHENMAAAHRALAASYKD